MLQNIKETNISARYEDILHWTGRCLVQSIKEEIIT
jgi:hypothetical protein